MHAWVCMCACVCACAHTYVCACMCVCNCTNSDTHTDVNILVIVQSIIPKTSWWRIMLLVVGLFTTQGMIVTIASTNSVAHLNITLG